MTALKFSRDELVEALDARRPWAEEMDRRATSEHKALEREAHKRFKALAREAAKWDYATAKSKGFTVELPYDERKDVRSCPTSTVEKLDRMLKLLLTTRQSRFTIESSGSWRDVFWLLTHDEDAEHRDLCA